MNLAIDPEARRMPAKVAACRFDALESQAIFKVMLDTTSRPGLILDLPRRIVDRIPSALAPLVVLADVETRVHVIDTPTFVWSEAVTSATGARPAQLNKADLIAVPADGREQLTSIFTFAHPGSAFSPESGARLMIGVNDIRSHGTSDSAGVELVIRGPGVEGERILCIDGLTEADVNAWRTTNSRFPAGIDVWLTTEAGRIVAIPRSSRLDVVAAWPTQERK
jgi:alpha-D-ribose 1-methylphosphonate 5-triphosphate synthase subunit PhnH